MSEPFLGEIRMFAGSYAPRDWALCDGQLIPISDNPSLYAILGDRFGGDGRVSFALPDLRGRVPVHAGAGHGTTNIRLAEMGGVPSVPLSVNELPAHSHMINVNSTEASESNPANGFPAKGGDAEKPVDIYAEEDANATFSADAVTKTGSGTPHYNMQPYTGLNFIIALDGTFPPRT